MRELLGTTAWLHAGLFLRMAIRRHGVFVREFAVLHGSGGVLLGVIVLAEIVMMGRLEVVMRGGVMVRRRHVVVFTCGMGRLLRICLGV